MSFPNINKIPSEEQLEPGASIVEFTSKLELVEPEFPEHKLNQPLTDVK